MKLLCVVVFAAGCAGPSLWRNFKFADPESFVRTAKGSPRADAVVLSCLDRVLNVWDVNNEVFHQVQRHERILILTEAGLERANQRLPVAEGNKLVHFAARTITPDGREHSVDVRTVHDVIAADPHGGARVGIRSFHFPEVEIGSVLEWSWTTEGHGFLTWQAERVSRDLPVERYDFELWSSPAFLTDLRVYNKQEDELVSRADHGELHLFSYHAVDVPATVDEKFAEPWPLTDRWWAFRVRSVEFAGREQSVLQDWGDAMKPLGERLYVESGKLERGFRAQLERERCDDLRCLAGLALEKARAVELSGFEEGSRIRPLREVMDSRTANQLEKAVLVWKLLKDAGVKLFYAGAIREAPRSLDGDFPIPARMDHLLLWIAPTDAEPRGIWIDPACESCRPGELPSWAIGAPAVVFAERFADEYGRKPIAGQLRTVEGTPMIASRASRKTEAVLDAATGNVSVHLSLETVGPWAASEAITSRAWQADDWQKNAEKVAHARLAGAQLVKADPWLCARSRARCVRQVSFELPSFASIDAGELHVPLGILVSDYDHAFERADRQGDVVFTQPFTTADELRLTLPAGVSVTRLPKPVRADFDGRVTVEVNATSEGNVVVVTRSLHVEAGRVPKADYARLRETVRAFGETRRGSIVLRAP